MKQLTKEQQKQAIELIEGLIVKNPMDNYIQSAKAFLQSLKPKIYVCQIRPELTRTSIYFFDVVNAICIEKKYAQSFDTIEQAREYKAKCEFNFPDYEHFIITE